MIFSKVQHHESSGHVLSCPKRRDTDTFDGRNPAPVDMVNIPLFAGFSYILGGAGFLPSTVIWRNKQHFG